VPIAMAYLEPGVSQDHPGLAVDIRGQAAPADLTDLPFYRRSQ
jgi:glycine cleavage system aminomethyltransferase T